MTRAQTSARRGERPQGVNYKRLYSYSTGNSRLTGVRSLAMTKVVFVVALVVTTFGVPALLDTTAVARADQIIFAPDWPNHRNQTAKTICAALAQGWTRRQIVGTAEKANNPDLTGMDDDEAAERADAFIDAARYQDCPSLNAG
jgi:hypothetical protein